MKEGDFWIKKLRPALLEIFGKRAVIIKHNQYYGAGIPDFTVTIGKHTEWFEVKVFPNEPTKLQAHMLEALGAAGHLITVTKDLREVCLDGRGRVDLAGNDAAVWLACEIEAMFHESL
jgi:hypothetical protein